MRTAMFSLVLMVTGCAGQPSAPTASSPTTFVSNVPVVTPAAPGAGSAVPADSAVLDAKKHGYTVVNENGETLYCHNTARTGSRVATETTCLTAKQISELREQTQRSLSNLSQMAPPPQGH